MRLFFAEIRKLLSSKAIAVIFAVLLLADFALTLYTAKTEPVVGATAKAYEVYLQDPAYYQAYFEALEAERESYDPKSGQSLSAAYTIDGTGKHSDYLLLKRVLNEVKRTEGGEFRKEIQRIIRTIDQKIEDMHRYGYSDATYTVRSQIEARERYIALLEETTLKSEYSRGYDTYLQNDIVSAFIVLFLTLGVSFIFLHDHSVAFQPILQTTRKGRLHTAAAKLSVSFCLAAFTTVSFLLTTFLAVGIAEGFSSPFSPIQNFEAFYHVPETITVLGYLIRHTALRLLAFLVYAALIALLSAVGLPYILCFGGGFAFVGCNCFFFYRTYFGTPPAIKYLNFASMTEGCALTDFYRTVNLFKNPVRMHTVIAVIAMMLLLILALAAMLAFTRNLRFLSGIEKKLTRFLKRAISAIGKTPLRSQKRPIKGKIRPFFCFELKKLRPVLIFVLLLVILCARYLYVNRTVGTMEVYSEILYYNYIEDVSGLSHEEREAYMTEERNRIDSILRIYSHNTTLYENGEMTRQAYSEYLNVYYTAVNENAAFERVEEYIDYVQQKNAECGMNGKLIYTAGYEKLFGLPSDLFLYAAVTILSFRVFSVEYVKSSSSGGFIQILRATKKGRSRTFLVKILTCPILSAILALFFCAAKFFAVRDMYVMTDLSEPLYLVQSFSCVTGKISILEYLITDGILTVFSAVTLSMVVVMLSFFLKKPFAVLTVTVLLAGLPELITSVLLPRFREFSLLSLTAPRGLYCRSVEKGMLGADHGYLVLICMMYFAIVSVMVLIAWKRYYGSHFLKMKGATR
jgi:hypothetical protein